MTMVLGGVAAILVWILFFRLFFSDRDEFLEAIRFWLTPDWFSRWSSEFWDNFWAELKLGLWFNLGLGAGVFVHFALLNLSTAGV